MSAYFYVEIIAGRQIMRIFADGRGCPAHDILTITKKRYAYLVNWKPRNFHNYAQGRHSGSHA